MRYLGGWQRRVRRKGSWWSQRHSTDATFCSTGAGAAARLRGLKNGSVEWALSPWNRSHGRRSGGASWSWLLAVDGEAPSALLLRSMSSARAAGIETSLSLSSRPAKGGIRCSTARRWSCAASTEGPQRSIAFIRV